MALVKNTVTLETGIDELNLSTRAYNCLNRAGIRTVGRVCAMSTNDKDKNSLKSIRDVGDFVKTEIVDKIHSLGFKFSDEDPTMEQEDGNSLEVDINRLENENQETTVRITDKRNLLVKFQQLLDRQKELANEEAELDKQIADARSQAKDKEANHGQTL